MVAYVDQLLMAWAKSVPTSRFGLRVLSFQSLARSGIPHTVCQFDCQWCCNYSAFPHIES